MLLLSELLVLLGGAGGTSDDGVVGVVSDPLWGKRVDISSCVKQITVCNDMGCTTKTKTTYVIQIYKYIAYIIYHIYNIYHI
jgi:hypothetical protein